MNHFVNSSQDWWFTLHVKFQPTTSCWKFGYAKQFPIAVPNTNVTIIRLRSIFLRMRSIFFCSLLLIDKMRQNLSQEYYVTTMIVFLIGQFFSLPIKACASKPFYCNFLRNISKLSIQRFSVCVCGTEKLRPVVSSLSFLKIWLQIVRLNRIHVGLYIVIFNTTITPNLF